MKTNNALLIIDMQEGFKTKYNRFLYERLDCYLTIAKFRTKFNNIITTYYKNDVNSPCYKQLNYRKLLTTKQQQFLNILNTCSDLLYPRNTYNAVNGALLYYLEQNKINEVHICGISTDCCVLATALDLFDRGYKVKIISNLCAASKEENHKIGLKVLKEDIGKENVYEFKINYN